MHNICESGAVIKRRRVRQRRGWPVHQCRQPCRGEPLYEHIRGRDVPQMESTWSDSTASQPVSPIPRPDQPRCKCSSGLAGWRFAWDWCTVGLQRPADNDDKAKLNTRDTILLEWNNATWWHRLHCCQATSSQVTAAEAMITSCVCEIDDVQCVSDLNHSVVDVCQCMPVNITRKTTQTANTHRQTDRHRQIPTYFDGESLLTDGSQ